MLKIWDNLVISDFFRTFALQKKKQLKGDMGYIIVEINGIRHRLVKDNVMHDACSECTLRFMCGNDDICSSLGRIDYHFEIE